MKPLFIFTIIVIVLISGCFGTVPKNPAHPATQKQGLPDVIGTPPTRAFGEAQATSTPKPTPTPKQTGNFTITITTLSRTTENINANLTVAIEVPKSEYSGNITLGCNNSKFVGVTPNMTSVNYNGYILSDVNCKTMIPAWIAFGKYNVSTGIPSVDGKFSVNVTRKP